MEQAVTQAVANRVSMPEAVVGSVVAICLTYFLVQLLKD